MKEQEDLLALMFPPESLQKAKERKFHVRQFFYDTFLPKVREGDIKTTEDVYNTLSDYRRLHNINMNIAHIFPPARMHIIHVISQRQLGITPLDFFEIDLAFSLVRDAILKDDRAFLQSEQDTEPDEEFKKTLRSAVRKVSRDIELKKARLKTPRG